MFLKHMIGQTGSHGFMLTNQMFTSDILFKLKPSLHMLNLDLFKRQKSNEKSEYLVKRKISFFKTL